MRDAPRPPIVPPTVPPGHVANLEGRGEVFAGVDVPAGVLLTTEDQLVRPAKQRQLAAAVRADVVELAGDHFCFMARAEGFAEGTRRLVDGVVARLGSSQAVRAAG